MKVETPEKVEQSHADAVINESKETKVASSGSPPLRPPGLPIKDHMKAQNKQKKKEKKKAATNNGDNEKHEFKKTDPKGNLDDFVFDNNDEEVSDTESVKTVGLGWSRSPLQSDALEDKVKYLLGKHNFSSLSAKKIQKEHNWLSLTTQAYKRLNTSPDGGPDRRIRSRSICI